MKFNYVYIHMGVHMYVGWMDVRTYVRMDVHIMYIVCTYVRMYVYNLRMYLLVSIIYAHIHGCTYVRTYVIHMIDFHTSTCLSRGAQ